MAKYKFDLKKGFSWFLITFVSVAFIWFFSLTGNPVGRTGEMVGKVNGKPIFNSRGSDFAREYLSMAQSYKERGGEITDPVDHAIRSQALSSVAMKRLLEETASARDIVVADSDLVNYIKQRYFVENGRFQEQAFRQFQAKGEDTVKQSLEMEAKRELTVQTLTALTLFQLVPVTSEEVFDRLQTRNFKKKAMVASLNLDDYVEKAVTEGDLKVFFESHRTNFAGKDYASSRSEVQTEYLNQNIQILRSRVKAQMGQEVSRRVADGSFARNFAGTARELGMRVATTDYFHLYATSVVDEGDREIRELSDRETIAGLMGIPKGQVSPVLETSSGLLVGLILDSKEPKAEEVLKMSFMRKRVEEEIRQEKIQTALQTYQDQIYKKARIESLIKERTAQNSGR